MVKKNIWLFLLVIVLAVGFGVGATYALLLSRSQTVVNEFSAGGITLILTETTGTNYKIIPGVTHRKDPVITVKADSQACWLFFELDNSAEFESYMEYTIADGWTALGGYGGVYWKQVPTAKEDTYHPVLKDDQVTVKATVTEEMLSALDASLELIISPYAIQTEGIDTPVLAWETILQMQEG